MKRKPGALYFTDVAIARDDEIILTGNYYDLEDSREERIALLSLIKGKWGGMDLSGTAHAVRVGWYGSEKAYYVLERNRGLYVARPTGTVQFVEIARNRQGFLMDLRKIGRCWYAVGGHHQVHILALPALAHRADQVDDRRLIDIPGYVLPYRDARPVLGPSGVCIGQRCQKPDRATC